MTETAPHVEVELKYRVLDLAAAESYLAAGSIGPFVGASQARATQLEDRYVDTHDGALARAGFAARLRITGAGTIVSIKALGSGEGPGGSRSREEIEGPADRGLPAIDWPASDARSFVLEHAGDAALLEVLTVRQLRRKRQLRDGATRIELSLDEVDVVTGKRVAGRFVELEAELLKGDPDRLAGLAVAFEKDPNLRRSTSSKFAAALAAIRGEAEPDEDLLPTPDSSRPRNDAAVALDPERVEVKPSADVVAAADPDPTAPGTDPDPTAPAADPDPTASAAAADAAILPEPPTDLDDGPVDLDDPYGPEEPDAGSGSADPGDVSAPDQKAEGMRLASDPVADPGDRPGSGAREAKLSVGKTPGVLAEDHVAEAGRKVLRFHLARMLAREAGTRTGVLVEDLHSMRVATRRQRAAWRVFGDAFRPARTKRFRKGLREVAARLGAVRDLDVLLKAADGYRADLPVVEQRALEPLLADWRSHREDARVLLLRELDSDGYRRWVDDYRDFVRTDGAAVLPVGPVQPHRVRDTAPSRIWAAYEQVRGYEPVLRWADVETLHDLRIAAKWLRYSLEFVREALGDEAAPLIARVTAMQDHLGEMHDADVSASMARAYLVAHAGDLSGIESAAIARYLVNREREVVRLRRTLATPWRGVAGLPFRRSLGRVVAGL